MQLTNFIDGSWVNAHCREQLEVRNPATGELLGLTPLSGNGDVGRAVDAAHRAFPGWRATPPVERARVLFRLKALLEQHADALSASITREHGKNIAESRGELQRGIENIEHACGIPTLMQGESLEDVGRGIDCVTYRQPLGVFAAITPYNFPVMIPLWFWPYAVATGNTFVLKPSEQDPLTHQRIVDLAIEAGLPRGVLNVVHGGSEAVRALLEHPDVVGVSFVGSSQTARFVYATGAAHGKRVQALGGAKNHMIVLPDANLDLATEAVVSSAFGCTGQRCLAGSVVVGVGEAHDAMRARVLERAGALHPGNGLENREALGPLISARLRERVNSYIAQGEQSGARLLLDGRAATVRELPNGHWAGATVFDDVAPDMTIGRDEIFGPVLGLARAESVDDAIAFMHRSAYGNATSLFTSSGRAAREFRYRAGISMIGVNIGVAAPMAVFPFGGARASFYGDLKAQGSDAVAFYTDRRVVISRWS